VSRTDTQNAPLFASALMATSPASVNLMALPTRLISTCVKRRPSPRKKRTRPEPRQYNLVDLVRARDRVEAAYRRVENDRTNNPSRARAGLERARLDLYAIESDLRRRGIIE
jgi:hypothetical protein